MLRRERGDTLIEVLLSVLIFSMVAVAGITVMSQGVASAQRSLEMAHVRNEIDGQAEALRYLHETYVAALSSGTPPSSGGWSDLMQYVVEAASQNIDNPEQCPEIRGIKTPRFKPFFIDPAGATVRDASLLRPATTFSQLRYDTKGVLMSAEGLWIEAVQAKGNNDIVDFHIRACWDSPGGAIPIVRGTIVRLYVPTR